MALMKTKRNGEPPSKITVKTKREAYVPNVENQRKMAEYESALGKNKAIEDKYKSDVESYGRQMKAYSEQPKGRKEFQTLFSGGGRFLSESELTDWNKQKSGDRGGLQAKKVYVSKGYGKEQSSGPMKGDKGAYSGYLGAAHEWFDKPTAPTSPKMATVERPKLGIERMPLNKVTGISTKRGELAEPTKWEQPELRKIGNVEQYYRTKKDVKKENKLIGRTIENVKRKAEFKKELKQGKAYFGTYAGETAGDIRAHKKAIKEDIKDVLTTRPIKGLGLVKKDLSKLKTARQAEKYVKKAGREYTGLTTDQTNQIGNKVRFATPEKFKGYKKTK